MTASSISRRAFFTVAGGASVWTLSKTASAAVRGDPAPADQEFDRVVEAATRWVEQQRTRVLKEGRPLDVQESTLARTVGVRAPEEVRLLDVEAVPFPTDTVLKPFLERLGFRSEYVFGMTAGHGIYRRLPSVVGDIRAHEFRHVAQFECFGSIRSYAFFYLKEMLHFPPGAGPLEIDAEHAAKMTAVKERETPNNGPQPTP